MYWEKRHLIARKPLQGPFKNLVDRTIRERRRDERRVAEQRGTKHQLQARKSCVADARSYRIARRLPVPVTAQFEWKTLIPLEQLNKVGSACLKKLGDHQFKHWLDREMSRQHNVFRLLRRLTR
jgi:tRNA U38,U39,U40 pseudouridine synthase TruA